MKIRHTLIFWISVLILIITVPIALYYLTIGSAGGMGLAGVLLLGISILTLIIVSIEQALIKRTELKGRTILAFEIPILLCLLAILMYSERKINYTIDDKAEWFVIVESRELYEDPENSFPFNLNYNVVNYQILFINKNNHRGYHQTGVSWGGYSSVRRNVELNEKKYGFRIYFHPHYDHTESEVDSIKQLVKKEIKEKL